MKHSGSWIGGLLLFLAGLGGGWALASLLGSPRAETSAAEEEGEGDALAVEPADMRVQVSAVEATSGILSVTVTAPGVVRAAPTAELTLSSRAGGRVLEITAAPGQLVSRGDLLFSLDPTGAQTALSQARSTLAERANQLAEFERTGSARQKTELEGSAQRAISQETLLEAQVNRLGPLRSDGLVSDKAFAEAQQALESARGERELAVRALAAFSDSGESLQRETLRAARDAAELGVRDAERAFGEVDVRAPVDGQLVELYVRGGELTVPGSTLGRVLASVGREIVFQVPAEAISELKIGARASWSDAKGAPRAGTIVRIDGRVESVGGTLEAIAKPDDESAAFLAGVRVFGEIELRRLPLSVLVPERAVLRASDLQVVVVARDGKAFSVPVKVLGRHAGLAAIEGEVHEHDRVIVEGGYNLPDGAGVVLRSEQ